MDRELLEDVPRLKDYKVGQVTTHSHNKTPIPFKALIDRFYRTPRVNDHSDCVRIEPGSSFKFKEVKGPGIINHVWMTILPTISKVLLSPFNLKSLAPFGGYNPKDSLKLAKIKIYFDGKKRVDAPLGDFFGVGFGEYKSFTSRFLKMTSGGYVCCFPMPYWDSCRIEVENTSNSRVIPIFYGAVTYQEHESLDDKLCYFNAKYNEEKPTTKWKPYTILKAKGNGHLEGCVLNIKGNKRCLEGNLKIVLDDERLIEYTGIEDYFNAGWYFTKGLFDDDYHGLTVKKDDMISAYRFHEGGMPFKKGIKVSVHHGEFDELRADFSSVAYYYLKD